jgi:hypothetical protein
MSTARRTRPAAGSEHLDRGDLRRLVVRGLGEEGGRLGDPAADDHGADHDDRAQQERDAPSPRLERRGRKERREGDEDRGREDAARLRALEREAREEPALLSGGMLGDHRGRAAELAGDGEALDEAQHHEQDRCQHADLGVRGQAADEESRDAHDDQGEDQHALAPEPVAVASQHEGADGPREVADAVRRERRDQGDGRVGAREEHLREHDRRRCGVDREVVVLEHASEEAARCCPLGHVWRAGGLQCRAVRCNLIGHRSLLVSIDRSPRGLESAFQHYAPAH